MCVSSRFSVEEKPPRGLTASPTAAPLSKDIIIQQPPAPHSPGHRLPSASRMLLGASPLAAS